MNAQRSTRLSLVVAAAVVTFALMVTVRSENAADGGDGVRGPANPNVQDWACPSGTVGRTTCKFVSVPEDYSDPEIRQVRLFVSEIQPPLASSMPPIVFIGDELGGTTVAEFGEWHQIARATGRAIVLIDQRGSGRSEPRLACRELSDVPWLEAQLRGPGLETARNQVTEAIRACRESLSNRSNLDAYSLEAMATDVEVVRQQLEIDRWSVAAAGEATLVARRYEQLFRASTESLVLVGASPESAEREKATLVYAQGVLENVLGAELMQQLDEVVEPLRNQSFVFAIASRGRTTRVSVSHEVVYSTLARVAGDEEVRSTLPSLVRERLSAGQWRSLAVLRQRTYRSDNRWAAGVAFSVHCGDPSLADQDETGEILTDAGRSWVGLVDDPTLDREFCEAWGAPVHEGVSGVPLVRTLVVNGEYDIAAPAAAADELSTLWPDAVVLTLEESAQPDMFDACVVSALQAFLGFSADNIDQCVPGDPGSRLSLGT